jgi:hypothetical protein
MLLYDEAGRKKETGTRESQGGNDDEKKRGI